MQEQGYEREEGNRKQRDDRTNKEEPRGQESEEYRLSRCDFRLTENHQRSEVDTGRKCICSFLARTALYLKNRRAHELGR